MSSLNHHLFDLDEQICYVQCGFCTTILLVSVPGSSLAMVVTVRCGHCTSLLSVNMMKASFVPLHLFTSLNQDPEKDDVSPKETEARKSTDHDDNHRSPSVAISSDTEDEDILPTPHFINKPPEKRQRAPSAYNKFIKEEIKRLKKQNPAMPHKEAFSTAAKNWAHFPALQFKEDGENCDHESLDALGNEVFSVPKKKLESMDLDFEIVMLSFELNQRW